MTYSRVIACAGLALALGCSAAQAQWSENFDSYADGTLLAGVGGWDGWDGTAAAAGTVSSRQSRSGPHSIEIEGSDDAVHPFSGYTSGQWTLTAHQYIPTGGLTASTYFIVNNEYNHGGPYTWAVQMRFDPLTGMVVDDNRAEVNPIPVVFDQWAEIRLEIDLDTDTLETYYNGTLLSMGTYTLGAGDPLEIANLDLFTTGGVAYYDDISLIPAPASAMLLALGGAVAMRRRR